MPEPTASLDTVRSRPGGRSARVRESVLNATRAQLLESGFGSLSHTDVARRAGVDRATVYRRWPTRAHLTMDALTEIADTNVPVPNRGSLRADLDALASSVRRLLSDPRRVQMFRALSAAQAEDPALQAGGAAFWDARLAAANQIIERAVQRGELGTGIAGAEALEQLISPIYFRALVSGRKVDRPFVSRCVERVLASLRAGA